MSIDTTRPAVQEGALAMWTAGDVVDDLGSLPTITPRLPYDETAVPYLQPVLAAEKVRYVREPIAVVVAADRYAAEDAADSVLVDIDPVPPVIDLLGAAVDEPLFPKGHYR
jgi:CO/xanthine dehydrogenase Mo-binding subunit